MDRVIGWTLIGAVGGAGLVLIGALVFVELIQPVMFPPKPGEGFNALGFILCIFGPPYGAVVGGTAGLVWGLNRWGQSGATPANTFGFVLSFSAAFVMLCLLLVDFCGVSLKPLAWWLGGGLTADAVAGAAACFWLGRRSARLETVAPNPALHADPST